MHLSICTRGSNESRQGDDGRLGTALLVGTLTAPASAGITVYKNSNLTGASRYYDYSDCNYGDNVYSDGSPMYVLPGSAQSYSTSTQTYYFYWLTSDPDCIDRNPTGWVERLYPGQSFTNRSVGGHFKS